MALITAALVGTLAEAAAGNAAKSLGRKLRDSVFGTEKQKAFEKCLAAGILVMMAEATSESDDELNLLSGIFGDFFGNPSVGAELAQLIRGKSLDRERLETLFEEAGFDAETLPGLNFAGALTAFEAAFIMAAAEEPALQGTIQTNQLMAQTHISQQLLDEMRGLVAFLRDTRGETLQIAGGRLTALPAAGGETVTFRLSDAGQFFRPVDWESHYLRTLVKRCDPLDLTPIDETQPQAGMGGESRVYISDVFTTLNLEGLTRAEDQDVAEALGVRCLPGLGPAADEEPAGVEARASVEAGDEARVAIQAVEAVAALPRSVVLGQPGGGKSTLVNHIATQLAKRRLGGAEGASELRGWPADERPLPVRIILRHFAAWIPQGTKRGTAGLVWDYLEEMFEQWGCKEAFAPMKAELTDIGGVVFFDGLDEVRETDREATRTLVKESIEAFAGPLDQCKVVVTCREYAYAQGGDWHLNEREFRPFKLALFDLDQIKTFTETWYRVIGPQKGWGDGKALAEASNLNQAVNNQPHLKELAAYPLLLTLMAQVHGRDGYLPRDRADLYRRAVNLLLAHWENRIVRDIEGGRQVEPNLVMQLGVRTETLLGALERVAFSAHERQETEESRGQRTADIPKEELREVLAGELSSRDKAEQVIDYIQERAGLLQALDNRTYSFPHRTFQEYLAATHIMKQGEFDTLLRDRVRRDAQWWREVFLLSAGTSRSTPRNISEMIDRLLPQGPGADPVTQEKAEQVRIAAQAIQETNFHESVQKEAASEPGRFSATYRRVQDWLVAVLRSDTTVPVRERVGAGGDLADLGEVRREVSTLDEMQFCLVPAGPFWMGDRGDDEKGLPDNLHENTLLDYDFWMGRFPVTEAQFREFMAESRWWRETGPHPAYFNKLNDPAWRVPWAAALAFCGWLTERWRASGMLPAGFVAGLPSETEWEKAARGGVSIPHEPVVAPVNALHAAVRQPLKPNPLPQRIHPWGDHKQAEPRYARAMTLAAARWWRLWVSKFVVGCFPSGVSPYGCEEMVENTECWTRSIWGKDEGRADFGYPYRTDDGRESLKAPGNIFRVVRGWPYYRTISYRRTEVVSDRGRANTASGLRIALVPEAVFPLAGLG